mgnify:CR=1 FL=1
MIMPDLSTNRAALEARLLGYAPYALGILRIVTALYRP